MDQGVGRVLEGLMTFAVSERVSSLFFVLNDKILRIFSPTWSGQRKWEGLSNSKAMRVRPLICYVSLVVIALSSNNKIVRCILFDRTVYPRV